MREGVQHRLPKRDRLVCTDEARSNRGHGGTSNLSRGDDEWDPVLISKRRAAMQEATARFLYTRVAPVSALTPRGPGAFIHAHRATGSRGTPHEAHISTQQSPARTQPRIPRSDGHKGRAKCALAPAGEGSSRAHAGLEEKVAAIRRRLPLTPAANLVGECGEPISSHPPRAASAGRLGSSLSCFEIETTAVQPAWALPSRARWAAPYGATGSSASLANGSAVAPESLDRAI